MLTDDSAIMGELSQGQMSDLSQASANENSGPPAPTPPGSADVLRAKQCMRLQISLDADTYMCSWAEELERQRGAGPSNDDADAASAAAPAAPDDLPKRGLDFDRMNPPQNRFQKMVEDMEKKYATARPPEAKRKRADEPKRKKAKKPEPEGGAAANGGAAAANGEGAEGGGADAGGALSLIHI